MTKEEVRQVVHFQAEHQKLGKLVRDIEHCREIGKYTGTCADRYAAFMSELPKLQKRLQQYLNEYPALASSQTVKEDSVGNLLATDGTPSQNK